jgi:hypothetical protein
MLLQEEFQVALPLLLLGRLRRPQDYHLQVRAPISRHQRPEVAHMDACLLHLPPEGLVQRLRGRDKIVEHDS